MAFTVIPLQDEVVHFDECPFECRDFGIVVDEKTRRQQKIYFHTCLMEDYDLPCPFPAKLCHFVKELEDFEDYFFSIVSNIFDD